MTTRSSARCLLVSEWPVKDQKLWLRISEPGCILDEYTPRAASWRAPTLEKVRKGYGRWLHFLMSQGLLVPDSDPIERIILANVRPYVESLQAEVAPETVWSYVTSLHQTAVAFAPTHEWGWLYRITAKLKSRSNPTRQKHARLRPAAEVFDWATNEMNTLSVAGDYRPTTAIAYRDALMIALLTACPTRLRNLAMIEIGRHLVQINDRFQLRFAPLEVKNNRYISMELPSALTPFLKMWLQEWRPKLCKSADLSSLWIGVRGGALGARGIQAAITKRTKRAFGHPINPHLFRDIAATSTAIITPANIGIAGSILGHLTPQAAEDHYIHASQITAGRKLRQSVNKIRSKQPPRSKP